MNAIQQGNIAEEQLAQAARLTREQSLMGVLNEACKTSIAINGGAAVAMGALLQAILDRSALGQVREVLLCGIGVAALGVLLGAMTFLLRYVSLQRPPDRRIVDNIWGAWALALGLASLFTFAISVAIPLAAGFRTPLAAVAIHT